MTELQAIGYALFTASLVALAAGLSLRRGRAQGRAEERPRGLWDANDQAIERLGYERGFEDGKRAISRTLTTELNRVAVEAGWYEHGRQHAIDDVLKGLTRQVEEWRRAGVPITMRSIDDVPVSVVPSGIVPPTAGGNEAWAPAADAFDDTLSSEAAVSEYDAQPFMRRDVE